MSQSQVVRNDAQMLKRRAGGVVWRGKYISRVMAHRGTATQTSVNEHTSHNSPRSPSATMIPTSSSPGSALPMRLLALPFLLLLVHLSFAQPATLAFGDCYSGDASRKMSVDTVYSQIIDDQTLNITVLGDTAAEIINSNTSLGMFTCHLLARITQTLDY